MASYVYPSGDNDRPEISAGFLGSHWNSAYHGQGQVTALVAAINRLETQKLDDLASAISNVSRLQQPIFETDRWYLLAIKQSELNTSDDALLEYNDPDLAATYGSSPDTGILYEYGIPSSAHSNFPLPEKISEIPFICNGFGEPTIVLAAGADFFVETGGQSITFRSNPFDDSRWLVEDIYEDGEVVDRQLFLWCFKTKIDKNLVYKQFGYVIGLELDSSEEYRDYINAVWDAAVEGTAAKQVDQAIAAIVDTPVVASDEETVENVISDARHFLVITDRNVYRYPTNAQAIVSAGDIVRLGDQLVDTVTIFEFGNGSVPSREELQAIEIGDGFLVSGFQGGIAWDNRDVAVSVDTSGVFTKVTWELGGFPGDVAAFWDLFHSRGIENPPTLAQLLDQRENPAGEPVAANIPATINPMEFLVQNVLRNNAYVVVIRLSRRGDNRLPLNAARKLQSVVPPHTAMIIVTELAADEEIITLSEPGTSAQLGLTEDPSAGFALEPIAETITLSSFVQEELSSAYTGGNCI